jgi:hypothetical protein
MYDQLVEEELEENNGRRKFFWLLFCIYILILSGLVFYLFFEFIMKT